jgi:hypothetical protein
MYTLHAIILEAVLRCICTATATVRLARAVYNALHANFLSISTPPTPPPPTGTWMGVYGSLS